MFKNSYRLFFFRYWSRI